MSDDLGETWESSDGRVLARIGAKEVVGVEATIKPGAEGARVFEIPMNSGILNQEGQAVDWEGGFWVLNRELVGGAEKWMVYRRDCAGESALFTSVDNLNLYTQMIGDFDRKDGMTANLRS